MDKTILRQYEILKKELADTRKRADSAERQLQHLEKLQDLGSVKDVVKGGEGGWQTFHIEGMPHDLDLPLKTARQTLENRVALLKLQTEECAVLLQETELFIKSIKDAELRMIIKHRFIDGATWENVAARMGYQYTEDMVRMKFNRFMEES